jgi:dynein intermediate chain 2
MDAGMNHREGGWPKDVDPNEVEQTMRYRKKVEKDDHFLNSVAALGEVRDERVCERENQHTRRFLTPPLLSSARSPCCTPFARTMRSIFTQTTFPSRA